MPAKTVLSGYDDEHADRMEVFGTYISTLERKQGRWTR